MEKVPTTIKFDLCRSMSFIYGRTYNIFFYESNFESVMWWHRLLNGIRKVFISIYLTWKSQSIYLALLFSPSCSFRCCFVGTETILGPIKTRTGTRKTFPSKCQFYVFSVYTVHLGRPHLATATWKIILKLSLIKWINTDTHTHSSQTKWTDRSRTHSSYAHKLSLNCFKIG